MFGNQHFYHEHIRKIITVFGAIFNDISIVKKDNNGKVIDTIRVPLSYGPKQKFLARIRERETFDDPTVAIRLPRMSFEMTSLTYNTNMKLQRGSVRKLESLTSSNGRPGKSTILHPVPYTMSIDLSIMARTMDDSLQIIEQILPFFQPEYTVTINEIGGRFKSDVPFTLSSVTLSEEYEGDFESRRAILHTLSFDTIVRMYGPLKQAKDIREVKTNLINPLNQSGDFDFVSIRQIVDPRDAPDPDKEEDYQIITVFDVAVPSSAILTFKDPIPTDFDAKEIIIGLESVSTAVVTKRIDDTRIEVRSLDGNFMEGELIAIKDDSSIVATLSKVEAIWA